MQIRIGLTALAVLCWAGVAVAQPTQGNWEGEFTEGPLEGESITAQIVGTANDEYDAILYLGDAKKRVVITGESFRNGLAVFTGDLNLEHPAGWFNTLAQSQRGVMEGTITNPQERHVFRMERVTHKSPTLGLEPPQGAVVMLDGTEATRAEQWYSQSRWITVDNGAMQISGSSTWTKEQFGDQEIHVEFRTPYMPGARGQARGNAGVYVHGRYEVQVLDSFADEPADNRCGGIYQQAVPIVNMCLPPGEWQTYDITFTAPRFDDMGNKTSNARITVKHNGVVIHDDLELQHATPGGLSGNEGPLGHLLIQDHGDTVQFRNIWIKPL